MMSLWIAASSWRRKTRSAGKLALSAIEEGQVRHGTVRTLMDFGGFIDLGGVDGLLDVTDMSWTRVGKPSDLLKVGQKSKSRS